MQHYFTNTVNMKAVTSEKGKEIRTNSVSFCLREISVIGQRKTS